MVVLLSESAGLTARETLTVLGSGGVRADALTAGGSSNGRFSRWRRQLIPAPSPGTDPLGYLSRVSGLCSTGEYEAVPATHEQAWLFAAGRHLLPPDAPIAVAPIEAFDRIAGKAEFATLCDELDIPQPRWWWCDERSTGGPVMGQAPAVGECGQVQALFEHGWLVAAHTSVRIGAGTGGSAAARLSADHPAARDYATRVGAHLRWHGGLTLDYFHVDGQPEFIECNPRTVEPGNAAHAGVDLPPSPADHRPVPWPDAARPPARPTARPPGSRPPGRPDPWRPGPRHRGGRTSPTPRGNAGSSLDDTAPAPDLPGRLGGEGQTDLLAQLLQRCEAAFAL